MTRTQSTKDRIVAAARELILDSGLDAFTVEAVASASGAARTTVYRHWPEPHDLLVETLASLVLEFEVPDTGSLRGDLLAGIEAFRPALEDNRIKRLILDVTRAAMDHEAIEKVRLRLIQDRRKPIELVLQRAIGRGEVDPEIDLGIAVHLIEGPLMSATILSNRPLTPSEVDSLVNGIAGSIT
jgi:AcrR family transcriptional regulator